MSFGSAPDSVFEQIRKDFFQKYKSSLDKGAYHPKDVERIKADYNWLRAFYKHSLDNPDKCVDMVNEVLLWRKEFDCNNLLTPGKLPVPEELFQKGAMFKRNEDNQCNPMVHLVVRLHKKDNYPHPQVCRFLAFFFEKNYRFNLDDPIVLVLDMSDAGYSNLDMEMIKFIVACLKTYYPGLIDYLIVYQMPFIFNAAWKLIKKWLPAESIKLIKFVDKKSIKEFVHESQLFVHMGGTDSYKYTYKRDDHVIKPPIESFQSAFEFDQFKSVEQPTFHLKEKIDEEEENINNNSLKTISSKSDFIETSSMKSKRNSKSSFRTIPNHIKQSESNQNSIFNSSLISISPGDELTFNVGDAKTDIVEYITLTNNTDTQLAYKIKITSPDKFRVKPGTGLIPISGTTQIMVNFLKEFHQTNNNQRDKFLILWTQVDDKIQSNDLNEFWKQAALTKKSNIDEHKMKCIVKRLNDTKQIENSQLEQSVLNDESVTLKRASKILGDSVLVERRTKTVSKPIEVSEQVGFTVDDKNFINSKLYNLDKNVNELLANEQKILNKNSKLMFLIYFLILLNLIQIIFQTNLFSQN